MSRKKVNLGESRIAGAGIGLFAAEDIKRGHLIVHVTGPRITIKEIEESHSENDYLLELNDGTGDCIEVQGDARFANDAKGRTSTPGIVNNALFRSADDHSMYLEATRAIKSGEEILVNYGKGYWI